MVSSVAPGSVPQMSAVLRFGTRWTFSFTFSRADWPAGMAPMISRAAMPSSWPTVKAGPVVRAGYAW